MSKTTDIPSPASDATPAPQTTQVTQALQTSRAAQPTQAPQVANALQASQVAPTAQAPQAPQTTQTRNGVIAGIFCYVLWGFMPLYWKLLGEVNSLEVICHRIIWCFVLTATICVITKLDFIALLVGVLINSEPFTFAHAVCFGCIWSGLALVAIDSLRPHRA